MFSIPFPAQVEVAKKSYHMTCKEEKLAATREANSKGEASTPAEQKKLQEKLEKCKQDSQKVRTYTGMTLWEFRYANIILKNRLFQKSKESEYH